MSTIVVHLPLLDHYHHWYVPRYVVEQTKLVNGRLFTTRVEHDLLLGVATPHETRKATLDALGAKQPTCDYCSRESITECPECDAFLCIDCQRDHACNP